MNKDNTLKKIKNTSTFRHDDSLNLRDKYCGVLEVNSDASQKEIIKAYRKMALK
jgi:hypothetical protein